MSASLPPVRLGYIVGYGRSGSTVLDIVLGAHPALLDVGELFNLTARAWPSNEYCSCGARVRDCPFWSAVVGHWTGCLGSRALALYARLQARYETLAVLARHAVDRLGTDGGLSDYGHCTQALLASLVAVSGKSVIVDSSKLPGRALCLMRLKGLDTRFIHLVRDGRGVAWSLGRALPRDERGGVERPLPARTVPRTALRWAVVNLGAEWVARRAGAARAIRLRYEDFCSAPEPALRRIGRLLELDLEPLVARLQQGDAFDPGHLVAGSRLRMAGPLRLSQDSRWRQQMPAHQQQLFQLFSGWLQHRYGYR